MAYVAILIPFTNNGIRKGSATLQTRSIHFRILVFAPVPDAVDGFEWVYCPEWRFGSVFHVFIDESPIVDHFVNGSVNTDSIFIKFF